jgi:D-serine deaminase-like pyridoxal phosphate-dependent protein
MIARRAMQIRWRMQHRHLDLPQHLLRVATQLGSIPAALVDLDAFDGNVTRMVGAATAGGKTVRIATKSVRCIDLLCRIAHAVPQGQLAGFMTFSAHETLTLLRDGRLVEALRKNHTTALHSHFLLAYPVADTASALLLLEAQTVAAGKGVGVGVVIDDAAHVEAMRHALHANAAATPPTPLMVWVDLDMSWRPLPFGLAHIGVRRSPLRTVAQVTQLAQVVHDTVDRDAVRVGGVMGYEAQVAGLTDFVVAACPSLSWLSLLLVSLASLPRSLVKWRSEVDGHQRRASAVIALRSLSSDSTRNGDVSPIYCNGGGSGSLHSTARDASVTEVTIGSGALCGHLFDGYLGAGTPHFDPALFFVLRITRRPAEGFVTCFGGGWVASGEAGPSRLPLAVHPRGATLLAREGAGEVQTPLLVPKSARADARGGRCCHIPPCQVR